MTWSRHSRADRTDQPFSISILPRGARRRRSIADAYRSESANKDLTIGPVPVTNEIAGSLFPAAGFRDLICDPFNELAAAAYQKAAEEILRRAPNTRASAVSDELPMTGRIPLPEKAADSTLTPAGQRRPNTRCAAQASTTMRETTAIASPDLMKTSSTSLESNSRWIGLRGLGLMRAYFRPLSTLSK